MKNSFLKLYTLGLFNNKTKKYQVSIYGLTAFSQLRPRAQELFINMLKLVGSGCSERELLVSGSYRDFGFNDFPNFTKYRDELILKSFIEQVDGGYYLNPNLIIYYNRGQKDYFKRLLGIKKDIAVNFGVKDK